MNSIERFRASTRQVHIWIFTVLSMFLSIVTTAIFMYHIVSGFNVLYVLGYASILGLSTLVMAGIPAVDSQIEVGSLPDLVIRQKTNFKVFTLTYFWIGLGLLFYPILHLSSTLRMFESPLTGAAGGILFICLGIQFIVLNYLTVGYPEFSEEDVQTIKDRLEEIDDFDPDDHNDTEIESKSDPDSTELNTSDQNETNNATNNKNQSDTNKNSDIDEDADIDDLY